MLRLDDLACGYGQIVAAAGVSLGVERGQVVALLGPNGAGKSSTILCIAGHTERKAGRILFEEEDIAALTPQQRVARGIALAPEGRRLFADLTVRENLRIGGYCRAQSREAANLDAVLELFPRLGERLNTVAAYLSGGEQQMVTIGRALMAEPKLLMIDEVSLGLMPKNVDACYEAIARLKQAGLSILIVEQNTARALSVADHAYLLDAGALAWQGSTADARRDPSILAGYLGTA
jgi:branched-chain amino acid transport system ATP-binding protein